MGTMANEHSGVKFFIITTSIILAVLISSATGTKDEEEGSLFEFAQSLLQESARNQNSVSGLNVLSGLVQGIIQGEGGKQLRDMLMKNKNGVVDIAGNLASIWQASKFNVNVNTDTTTGQNDINIDPSILGSIMDLFSNLSKATTDSEDSNVDENNNEIKETEKQKMAKAESPLSWNSVLSIAGSLGSMLSSLSKDNQVEENKVDSNGEFESFLSFLPVLMNSFAGQHNSHFSQSIPHHTHPQYLPQFLENLHEYWDHFSNSEFGKTLLESSGLSELIKAFSNSKGELDTNRIFDSLENNTFRRRWIKSISGFVAHWVKHFINPKIQKSYLKTGETIFNSFLRAQGYPEKLLIDLNNPAKSISALANAVFKRQFNLAINSEVYLEPAISYIQEIFKIGQKKGFGMLGLSSEDIESKLSETIDSDVIEPILRVNRAYKFGLRKPNCGKYVICIINQNRDTTKAGLKPGITKLASLGASWFLSTSAGISYWDLYNAAVNDESCSKFDRQCSEFHTEDIKATTEYYHNEL